MSDLIECTVLRVIPLMLTGALLTSAAAAQRCNYSTGGAGTSGAEKCHYPGVRTPSPTNIDGPTTPGGGRIPGPATGRPDRFQSGLDYKGPELSDPGPQTVLNGGGTFHLASGELTMPLPLVSLGGLTANVSVPVSAVYRSQLAHPGTDPVDIDPTGYLPFGPGWLPSFAEGLLKSSQVGGR